MPHGRRFALIDKQGRKRFAAIINGTFQIGKDRRRTPADLVTFARAILVEGEDGRFECADGTMKGVLTFISKRDVVAVAYDLDPAIAAKLGIPAQGSK